MRDHWADYRCQEGKMVSAEFGPTRIAVAQPTIDAWRALALVLTRHGYDIREGDTGAYNCREITGGTGPSLHAYGVAADVNWLTNPYCKTPDERPVRFSVAATQADRALDVRFDRADTDMTREMIDDVLSIVTNRKDRVFAWGGQFKQTKDTMHFQLDVSPEELAQGIDWLSLGADHHVPQDQTTNGGPGGPQKVGGRPGEGGKVMPGLTADVIAAAEAAQHKWGVPASVTLAQFILESGAGRHMPQGSNNPFGIKARTGEPSVAAPTHEVIGGRSVAITANFRKYTSFAEAFDAHARLLATGKPYIAAMRVKDDPNRFADALTGVYATDPQYGSKLRSIMLRDDLYQYDTEGSGESDGDGDQDGNGGDGGKKGKNGPSGGKGGGGNVNGSNLALGSRGAQVTALQQALVKLGYQLGAVDGIFGTLTRSALLAFQADNELPTTGIADSATWAAFDTAAQRPLSPERASASSTEVGKLGSQTIRHADNTKLVGLISSILGALGIGNSTIVAANQASTGSTTTTTAAGTQTPANLTQFIDNVQQLLNSPAIKALKGTTETEVTKVLDLAKEIQATPGSSISGSSVISPETLQVLQQIKQLIPADVITKNPDLGKVLDAVNALHPAKSAITNTVFDILPTMFANGSNLQLISDGVAAVAGSVIPGFGGSVAVLALGLAARYFGNQIMQARTQDHQDGSNLGR
jgi:peptidoglycan hydrolase-like protein with peptidoglycan-binding domain